MALGSTELPATPLPSTGRSVLPRDRGFWRSPMTGRRAFYGYLCLLPWILGFLGFTLYPVIASAYFSLTEYPILQGPSWIGLENYRTLFFEDDLFWKSLRITTLYTIVA